MMRSGTTAEVSVGAMVVEETMIEITTIETVTANIEIEIEESTAVVTVGTGITATGPETTAVDFN